MVLFYWDQELVFFTPMIFAGLKPILSPPNTETWTFNDLGIYVAALSDGIETQAHVNTSYCLRPALLDFRLLYRRRIELHLLALRYSSLPTGQHWIRPVVSFIEEHMWADKELLVIYEMCDGPNTP